MMNSRVGAIMGMLGLCSVLLPAAGCQQEDIAGNRFSESAYAGDPGDGKVLIRAFGCDGCHRIPGVRSATGRVGPSLENLSRRAYVGGILPNTYDGLVRWLLDPQAINPETAMPDTGLARPQAEAVAAYLYTLD